MSRKNYKTIMGGLCSKRATAIEHHRDPIVVINNDNHGSAITEVDLRNRRVVVIRGVHGKVSTSLLHQMNDDAERRDVSFSL
jgi:hypothetical protein